MNKQSNTAIAAATKKFLWLAHGIVRTTTVRLCVLTVLCMYATCTTRPAGSEISPEVSPEGRKRLTQAMLRIMLSETSDPAAIAHMADAITKINYNPEKPQVIGSSETDDEIEYKDLDVEKESRDVLAPSATLGPTNKLTSELSLKKSQ